MITYTARLFKTSKREYPNEKLENIVGATLPKWIIKISNFLSDSKSKPEHTILFISESKLNGWEHEYEFKIGKVLDRREFTSEIDRINFESKKPIDYFLDAYVKNYNGKIIETRMGKVAVSSAIEELNDERVSLKNLLIQLYGKKEKLILD